MAGRPREFDRDQALRKAMLLFWQHGYEGTSMSALVEALGIASARIYAAFGSKEQLFREAVALYEEGEGGFAPRALEQPADRGHGAAGGGAAGAGGNAHRGTEAGPGCCGAGRAGLPAAIGGAAGGGQRSARTHPEPVAAP